MAFEPLGDEARWRTVYSLLLLTDTGTVVTYEELGKALDLDPVEGRHAIQMAVRRAAQEHEQVDKRALDAVKNIGYRVVKPAEQLILARRQQRRSSRALVRGHSKAVNVDLSNVDPEVRKAFDVMAAAFSMQMDYNRRLDVRQQRLEEALNSVRQKTDRSDRNIDDVRARLAELEKRLTD